MMIPIYVASDQKMGKAELVLEYSIKKNTQADVEIHWMRAGEGEYADWNISREYGKPYSGRGWATDFTCFRFTVPECAGFKGRAIYLDVDMLLLGDIQELYDRETKAPWAGVGNRTDVSVIDCEEFEFYRDWPRFDVMKKLGHDLKYYLRVLDRHNLRDTESIPHSWDCLDGAEFGNETRLYHYTDMRTQPWKPWPEAFDYQQPHRHAEGVKLFWDHYNEIIAGAATE